MFNLPRLCFNSTLVLGGIHENDTANNCPCDGRRRGRSNSSRRPDDLPGPGEPTLAEVRTATEKYQDVKVALAEGYIRDPANMCETADMMGRPASDGAMGVHYFRPDLLGITAPPNPRVDGNGTHTDFHAPAILIYEPQADGSMQLVAVENLVFQASWAAAGHDFATDLLRRPL